MFGGFEKKNEQTQKDVNGLMVYARRGVIARLQKIKAG
jgi:hypothetical protein